MTAQLPCYIVVGSWSCLPTARHWVLVQKVPRESEEFQGTLIKIVQPARRSLAPPAQVTLGALAKLSSAGEMSLSPGKKTFASSG